MSRQGSAGNVLAALCSFFIPGLGQLLQGRVLLAAMQFGLAALLWIILLGWVIHLWSVVSAARYTNQPPARQPEPTTRVEEKSAASAQNNSEIEPIKVIPCTKTELERIQNAFKSYSPVQKSVRPATAPQEGEVWQTHRALPSGLFLGDNENAKLRTEFFSRLLGKKPKDRDYRPLQYDIEQHQRENPWLHAESRITYSVAWHPAKMLLITAGDGGLVKLWNAETGDLITVDPFWQREQDGEPACWSHDGDVFAGAKYIFDGRTGEALYSQHKNSRGDRLRLPGIGDRFKAMYWRQRVGKDARDTYYPSSAYNFSPWRPHSNQYVIHNFESIISSEWTFDPWKAYADSGWKCLVFRNRRSGEIEKVIDCDVTKIDDFAWHPKGQFIAIASDEDNVRIIDIDEARLIDGLSANQLVGWSPDGKILVARKGDDDFLVWDALEAKEKPMLEEIRNELWFKQFFNNTSADGLRYIENASIYSVESGQLLATLPVSVNCAAWSPIDGGLLATCGDTETKIWKLKSW